MSKLTASQQEQLVNLGLYLQQVRQEQGRTLEDIAAQIFIRPVLLQALEEGNAKALPEAVFVRGFLRRYGDALGLDGMALSRQFETAPIGVGVVAPFQAPVAAAPEPPRYRCS